MCDFFKGWRRKVGCVTLVIALAAMVLWTRSFAAYEGAAFRIGKRSHILHSLDGDFVWWSYEGSGGRVWQFPLVWSDAHEPGTKTTLGKLPDEDRPIHRRIPYWSFTVPLTLLSANLILWKPRQRKGPDHA